MRTLAWEGIELGNFILIASVQLWNQSVKTLCRRRLQGVIS